MKGGRFRWTNEKTPLKIELSLREQVSGEQLRSFCGFALPDSLHLTSDNLAQNAPQVKVGQEVMRRKAFHKCHLRSQSPPSKLIPKTYSAFLAAGKLQVPEEE